MTEVEHQAPSPFFVMTERFWRHRTETPLERIHPPLTNEQRQPYKKPENRTVRYVADTFTVKPFLFVWKYKTSKLSAIFLDIGAQWVLVYDGSDFFFDCTADHVLRGGAEALAELLEADRRYGEVRTRADAESARIAAEERERQRALVAPILQRLLGVAPGHVAGEAPRLLPGRWAQ